MRQFFRDGHRRPNIIGNVADQKEENIERCKVKCIINNSKARSNVCPSLKMVLKEYALEYCLGEGQCLGMTQHMPFALHIN